VYAREVVYALAITIIVLASLVLFFALIFFLAVLSPKVATEEHTKLKLARVYTFASFILGLFALIVALWFFFFVNWHLGGINT